MFAHTPISDGIVITDLGDAFERHVATYQGVLKYSLGLPETEWLNVIRNRAISQQDTKLLQLTNEMLDLLANPTFVTDRFKSRFMELYNQVARYAYPLAWSLLDEHHAITDITRDYTLGCFDFGMIRMMEDEALSSQSMKTFVEDMLQRLRAATSQPRHEIFRQVFDVYSEALVYRLLRERGAGRLSIRKIPETRVSGPDFECSLTVNINGTERNLEFYVEVKALDIVDAPQRLPEMLDAGMEIQIELERQKRAGKSVAMASSEIAPHRPYGGSGDYDPWSIRQVIETLIDKAAQNFKSKQFQRGPTFALANLLRLPLPGQGASSLAPFFYDHRFGGACISGALWHMAFGQLGAPIHRWPDFEGSGTTDGHLERAGLLIDPAVNLPAAGLIALHYDGGSYRFDGLFNANRTDAASGWSDIEVGAVIDALCGDYNDYDNSFAYKYARYIDR